MSEMATIDRDLEAVEAALASGGADHAAPEARELQQLALALAADAPEPGADFAEELRDRVAAGFPRPTRAHRRARGRSRLRTLTRDFAPLLGVAAMVLVIVGVVLVAGRGSGRDDSGALRSSGGGGAAESAASPQAKPTAGVGGGETAPQLDRGTRALGQALQGFAPDHANRRIERSYSLELAVPGDEMTRVADGVSTVASRHGGFVLSSSVNTGENGGDGEFSLRIPTDQLRPALSDLAELAPVKSQSQEGRDVTRQHVTAKDRLRAARAERRSLLRRLEAATTDAEAEAIRRRLDIVAGEINGLRAQLRNLRLRTDYAVVNVSLREAHKDSGGLGSFGNSLDDAGKLLAGFAGVTIIVLALAVPLSLIALLAWLTGRAIWRRRRESALA
jgi:uncharacterized protein DUF4349